jgi:hypothetical protein
VPDFKGNSHQYRPVAGERPQTGRIADILKNAEQREPFLASSATPTAGSATGVVPAAAKPSLFGNLPWRRERRGAGREPEPASGEAILQAEASAESKDGHAGPQTFFDDDGGGSGRRSDPESEPTHETGRAGPDALKENQARLLLEELTGLESRCATLAEQLSGVVRQLQAGSIPETAPGQDLSTLRSDVEALQQQAVELARSISLPAEDAMGPSMTLPRLRGVLEQLIEALKRRAFRDLHTSAALELEGVLKLEHRDRREFAPLLDCKTAVGKLIAEIKGAEWPDSHPECLPLIEGRHAYSQLLYFVRHGAELSDKAWESAAEAIANSFGKPLSIAAVRGRLHEGGDTAGRPEAVKHCPACNADIEADARFCDECGAGVE